MEQEPLYWGHNFFLFLFFSAQTKEKMYTEKRGGVGGYIQQNTILGEKSNAISIGVNMV